MAQPLLSDLCSICHSETPKYRCPRCKSQTCSLACYKRHQQRAACSGKRDPATYVKKDDLATPTGIDRDYNYLKGVERTIDDASRLASERGIGVEGQTWRRAASSRQPNSLLGKYLDRNSITVEYAPAGMSRQKTNRTRITNHGNIQWTVEWVDENGECCIKDDSSDSATLTELYTAVQNAKRKAERRQLELQRQGQAKKRGLKRKRQQIPGDSQQRLDDKTIQQEAEFLKNVRSDDAPAAADNSNETEENNQSAENLDVAEHPDGSSSPVLIITETDGRQGSTDQVTTSIKDAQNESQSSSKQHLYLLKPNTTTTSRVLIPLKADSTLTESLQNQTIQEYPTFYVLSNPPEALGTGFMLETDYLESIASSKLQSGAVDRTGDGRKTHIGAQHQVQQEHDAPLDAKSILNMLKRDIAL